MANKRAMVLTSQRNTAIFLFIDPVSIRKVLRETSGSGKANLIHRLKQLIRRGGPPADQHTIAFAQFSSS
jgi:hypothetical protein